MSTARKALMAIASRWPRDYLRPKRQFSDAIEKTANELYPVTSTSTTSPVIPSQPPVTDSKKSKTTAHMLGEINASKEKKMLDSLDRLLKSSAYMKASKLPHF
jgi:hypothetical protein